MSLIGPSVATLPFPNPIPETNTPTADYQASAVGATLGADLDLTTVFAMGFAREIFVGGAGTIVTRMRDSATNCTYTLVAGQILSGAFTKIIASGSTVTGIVARA